MEIRLRLDALSQSEADVLRLLPNIAEIHLYSVNPKSREGEVKVFSFIPAAPLAVRGMGTNYLYSTALLKRLSSLLSTAYK